MLNLDSRSRSKLLWVGTLLVPALAVQGVRFVLGGSPASATAATVAGPASPPPLAPAAPEVVKALTPAQTKALAWIHSHQQVLNERSPMDRPDVVSAQIPSLPSDTFKETAPSPTPAPPVQGGNPLGISITGIISGASSEQNIVSINHKFYRIGDEIAPGWRVVEIDARERTATLRGPEGQTIELALTAAAEH